jgi:hypothetical protein
MTKITKKKAQEKGFDASEEEEAADILDDKDSDDKDSDDEESSESNDECLHIDNQEDIRIKMPFSELHNVYVFSGDDSGSKSVQIEKLKVAEKGNKNETNSSNKGASNVEHSKGRSKIMSLVVI